MTEKSHRKGAEITESQRGFSLHLCGENLISGNIYYQQIEKFPEECKHCISAWGNREPP
ncbi:MAG: hypothetical protein V2I97_08805 [Desulfococcaceae bacterium]|nr:hypothetical protein [Desulfococcaceae bacterium]